MRGAGMMERLRDGLNRRVGHPDLAWQEWQAGRRQAALDEQRRAPRKILILSVKAGAGHYRAAEALRVAAMERGFDAVHLDALEDAYRGYRSLYTDAYLRLVQRWPRLWGWLYEASNRAQRDGALQRMRRALERRLARGMLERIAALRPDAVVCTHFLPAELLADARPDCPVWVQVTDFDLHRAWVQPGMHGYFAASDEVAFLMRDSGIAQAGIHVTGIPLMPAFSQRFDRAACARALGLDVGAPVVLLLGGGAGLGGLARTAARLLDAVPDFQLVVLCGHNRQALQTLQELSRSYPQRLFPQPYTHQVERLMACADLAITKPGGLTVSECLAQGLPMILHAPIPGQEERNAEYLLELGAAVMAASPAGVEYRLRALLGDRRRLAAMGRRAREAARPDAATRVIDEISRAWITT